MGPNVCLENLTMKIVACGSCSMLMADYDWLPEISSIAMISVHDETNYRNDKKELAASMIKHHG